MAGFWRGVLWKIRDPAGEERERHRLRAQLRMNSSQVTGRAVCARCDEPIVEFGKRGDGSGIWQHAPEGRDTPCPVPVLPEGVT